MFGQNKNIIGIYKLLHALKKSVVHICIYSVRAYYILATVLVNKNKLYIR